MSVNKSTGDPKQNSLGGNVIDVSVTASSSAQLVADLISSSLPTGYSIKDILEVHIAAKQSDASADRGAILWGSSTPITPLASGVGYIVPIRGAKWYIKRAGGSDVTTILTAILD